MLLLVTGSSCSGKTTAARGCVGLPNLAVHDSDEHGVPSDADTAWRQNDLRRWVLRAIQLADEGRDMLLTGQSPIGELLAVPESDRLPWAVCLLDVDDRTRRERLAQRDPGLWSPAQVDAFLGWARWHRAHAADPGHRPDVITTGAADGMAWARWLPPAPRPPEWTVATLDTTGRDAAETRGQLRD